MYLPTHFVGSAQDSAALVRAHPLGQWVLALQGELSANPVPWLLHEEPADDRPAQWILRGHVARANPVVASLQGAVGDSLVIFSGPQAYISPNWYPTKAQTHQHVPTWNYATVHIHGHAQLHDDADWLRAFLIEFTATHEAGQAQPWRLTDAPPGFVERLLKVIVGVEIAVTRVEGKFKLSQNRLPIDRSGVIEGLSNSPDAGARALAQLMQAAATQA